MIDHPQSPNTLPLVLDQKLIDACTAELTLQVQPELIWFDGHFPNTPILPGVVQLNWVRIMASSVWQEQAGWLDSAGQLEAVKFQQIIRPSDKVNLNMRIQPDPQPLQFTYFSRAKIFASRRLVAAQ